MTIKKVKGIDSAFSITPNSTVNDSLSWGAKGLLVYLCSKPDDWEVSVAQLVNHSKLSAKPTGRDGTYALIKELIQKGYIQRVQAKESGKFSTSDYIVSNTPMQPLTDLPYTVETSPLTDLPDAVSPHTAEPTQQRTELNKEQKLTKNTLSDSANHDAVEVLKYLNEITGSNFRSSTESHLKNIKGRLKDGATVEDCKMVIDFKHKQWKGTQQAQYLRPATLFVPKNFDGYLIAAKTAKPQHNVNDIGRDFSAPANWSN